MNLERHKGKCSVCQHPELAAIEADYLRWQTVESIRIKYDLPENSLNRHIAAFGLDEKGLRLATGQCNVKRYNAYLRDMIIEGKAKPGFVVSHTVSLDDATDANRLRFSDFRNALQRALGSHLSLYRSGKGD